MGGVALVKYSVTVGASILVRFPVHFVNFLKCGGHIFLISSQAIQVFTLK